MRAQYFAIDMLDGKVIASAYSIKGLKMILEVRDISIDECIFAKQVISPKF